VVLKEGGGFSTSVNYSWSKFHFMNSDLFVNNSDRTGFDNLVGITQSFTLSNTDINQFAQSLVAVLNAAAAQQQTSCSQAESI